MSDDIDRLFGRDSEERIKDRDLFETVEEVFDNATVMTILQLMRRKVIKKLSGVISAGKEARVYLGYGYDGSPLAVKIYLTSTAEFRKGIYKYIKGDPRFTDIRAKSTRHLIYAWARKEFRNLMRMHEAGVRVPRPIAHLNNVLVMQFLGEGGMRYPLLVEAYKDLELDELRNIYSQALGELEKIVCGAELVHGDFSEFNIMVAPDLSIYVIDVSQAVELSHPNAIDFLKRDIRNINRFFSEEVGIETLADEEIYERVISCQEKEGARGGTS